MAAGKIFINYRRDDSRGDAGRLYDHLHARYPGRIFRDVASLEPGVEWHDAIATVLGAADACIVVIGKNWMTVTNSAGQRRLEDPRDPVRQEILTALNNGMRVFPVLVGDADMPAEEELPADLRPLTRRNALEISEQDWDEDFNKLVGAIERSLGWNSEARRTAELALAGNQAAPTEGLKPATANAPAGQPAPGTARASADATPLQPRRSIVVLLVAAVVLLLAGSLGSTTFRLAVRSWLSQPGPQTGPAGSASRPEVLRRDTGNGRPGVGQATAAGGASGFGGDVGQVGGRRGTDGRTEGSIGAAAASNVAPTLPGPSGEPASKGTEPRPQAAVRPVESVSSNTSPGDQQSPSSDVPLPRNPPVFFQCAGVPEVCAALRAAFEQALNKESLPSVRERQRADVVIEAAVSTIDERVDQQFGTTFTVRTYSIDLTGEARRLGESVPMPAPTTFSFDARFGRDRLAENARVVADSAAEKVRAFWKKRVP